MHYSNISQTENNTFIKRTGDILTNASYEYKEGTNLSFYNESALYFYQLPGFYAAKMYQPSSAYFIIETVGAGLDLTQNDITLVSSLGDSTQNNKLTFSSHSYTFQNTSNILAIINDTGNIFTNNVTAPNLCYSNGNNCDINLSLANGTYLNKLKNDRAVANYTINGSINMSDRLMVNGTTNFNDNVFLAQNKFFVVSTSPAAKPINITLGTDPFFGALFHTAALTFDGCAYGYCWNMFGFNPGGIFMQNDFQNNVTYYQPMISFSNLSSGSPAQMYFYQNQKGDLGISNTYAGTYLLSVNYSNQNIYIKNKLIVGSDINETYGNSTINLPMAEMWFHNDSVANTTTITSALLWYNITALAGGQNSSNQTFNGFNFVSGNYGKLTCLISGYYKVDYSITGSGTANNKYHFTVAVNNIQKLNMESHDRVSNVNDILKGDGTGILNLNYLDNVTLQVMNENAGNNIDVLSVNLNTERLKNN